MGAGRGLGKAVREGTGKPRRLRGRVRLEKQPEQERHRVPSGAQEVTGNVCCGKTGQRAGSEETSGKLGDSKQVWEEEKDIRQDRQMDGVMNEQPFDEWSWSDR